MRPDPVASTRARIWGRGWSSCDPFDLGSERGDLTRGRLATRHLRHEPSGARGLSESDTLANPRGKSRRVMFGQRLGDLARNERAGSATVQDEPRNKLGTEAPCLLKQ